MKKIMKKDERYISSVKNILQKNKMMWQVNKKEVHFKCKKYIEKIFFQIFLI